jgi:hypothetical protein
MKTSGFVSPRLDHRPEDGESGAGVARGCQPHGLRDRLGLQRSRHQRRQGQEWAPGVRSDAATLHSANSM